MRLRGDQEFWKMDGGYAWVQGNCVVTGEPYTVAIPEDEYRDATRNPNKLMQDALPSVSKENREFLISGISPYGWVVMSHRAIEQDMLALDGIVSALSEDGDAAFHGMSVVQDILDKIVVRLKEIELNYD
jgi:hypothetical protein